MLRLGAERTAYCLQCLSGIKPIQLAYGRARETGYFNKKLFKKNEIGSFISGTTVVA